MYPITERQNYHRGRACVTRTDLVRFMIERLLHREGTDSASNPILWCPPAMARAQFESGRHSDCKTPPGHPAASRVGITVTVPTVHHGIQVGVHLLLHWYWVSAVAGIWTCCLSWPSCKASGKSWGFSWRPNLNRSYQMPSSLQVDLPMEATYLQPAEQEKISLQLCRINWSKYLSSGPAAPCERNDQVSPFSSYDCNCILW